MIICSCQSISDNDVNAAIDWMRAADPQTLITPPGKIYHALGGKKADCGGVHAVVLANHAPKYEPRSSSRPPGAWPDSRERTLP